MKREKTYRLLQEATRRAPRGTRASLVGKLRDAALAVARASSDWDEVVRFAREWKPGEDSSGLRVKVRIFEFMPRPPGSFIQNANHWDGWGLDVLVSMRKVMNVDWNEKGELVITAFRRGEWEDVLLNLAWGLVK